MSLRTPTLSKTRSGRGTVVKPKSFPAPITGWNARDSLASMAPTDAIQLENWYPSTSFVEMLGGYRVWTTGAPVGRTLMVYNGLDGHNQLLMASGPSISPASLNTELTANAGTTHPIATAKLYWTMFDDGTSNWLIACNGVDTPIYYDGTTYTDVTDSTSPALTGMTPLTSLIVPFIFKGRLFFLEQHTLRFWYLPPGVAGGALLSFDIGGECKKGGFIMAASSWTKDAGDGMDDLLVLITSEGEAIVYQGTNPSSAANWSKIGSFHVGRPLGRRCMAQFGGDLLILTEAGVFPLSTALSTAGINSEAALSYKIDSAFSAAVRTYETQYGWSIILYPKKNALIVNVPHQEGGVHEQFVMNTITKAWMKVTRWYAEDFALFNGALYFLTDYGNTASYVMLAWVGSNEFVKFQEYTYYSDLHPELVTDLTSYGVPIMATGKQAFNYLGSGAQGKHVTMYRPIIQVNGSVIYQAGMDINFQDTAFVESTEYTSSSALWDVAIWDTDVWPAEVDTLTDWTTPAVQTGFVVAPKLQITSNTATASWIATDVVYEEGNLP